MNKGLSVTEKSLGSEMYIHAGPSPVF